MERNQRVVFFSGLGLISGGIALVAIQIAGSGAVVRWIPLVAGVALCGTAVATRVPGMLLPGAMLAGLGLGLVVTLSAGESINHGAAVGVFLLCFGGSLSLVPALSLLCGYEFVLWPFPSAALPVLTGIGLVVFPPESTVFGFLADAWPVAVVCSVSFLVIVFFRRKRM